MLCSVDLRGRKRTCIRSQPPEWPHDSRRPTRMLGCTLSDNTLIAVLTWNGAAVTRRCLDTLRTLPAWPHRVVLVDNASGTGEGEDLGLEYGIAHLTTERNAGVAGGYNAAIGWACGRSYSHVLLLNNDTLIGDAHFVERLMSATGDRVAAVGPVVRSPDGPTSSAGGRLASAIGHAWHRRAPVGTRPFDVDWIDGSSMLISIDAIRDVGGFSEDYFLYWEEVDWCTRAKRRGWRIRVQPAAHIVHTGGATIPTLLTRRMALRNCVLFARRNSRGLPHLGSLAWWAVARVPVFLLRFARLAGARAAIREVRRAIAWNATDARTRGWWLEPAGPALCDESSRTRGN